MSRRGFSLLEIMISVAILAIVLAITFSALLATQQQVGEGTARIIVNDEARRVSELISNELRDLNLDPEDPGREDLIPANPFNAQDLQYRVVTGFAVPNVVLDPSRTSGLFHRLRFNAGNRSIERISGGNTIVLAQRIADLRFTLDPPNKLINRVTAERRNARGQAVQGTAQITVMLRNQIAGAN